MSTLLLSQSDVASVMKMAGAIDAVEEAFRATARGEALMPSKVYLDVEGVGDFRAMPALMGDSAGVKWVNSHPENPMKHKLPTVMGLYVLSDPDSALPLAVMDATLLTALRTGAASAVASRWMSRTLTDEPTLGIIGCGVQAHYVLEAHRVLWPDLRCVVYDVDRDRGMAFAEAHGAMFAEARAACQADIVCTVTPVRKPVVESIWIRPGTHINALGADAEGKQEIESTVLSRARVFVDDREQAAHSGEINVPLHKHAWALTSLSGTLGEVVVGRVKARNSEEDITLFDSTGLAVQDVALARAIFEAAKEEGCGTSFDFQLAGI